MGNQSQQSKADNRQQGFGGGQPETTGENELHEPQRRQPHQSGDRNANESMRDEGPERAPKK